MGGHGDVSGEDWSSELADNEIPSFEGKKGKLEDTIRQNLIYGTGLFNVLLFMIAICFLAKGKINEADIIWKYISVLLPIFTSMVGYYFGSKNK